MKARRRGISSIYGFVMIFLLSMASIQTWSYAVSSESNLEGASLQDHQIQEAQSQERLTLAESRGNLTISNSGQVSSLVEYMRLIAGNSSTTRVLDVQLAAGASVVVPVPSSGVIQIVTSLGNVFSFAPETNFDPLGLPDSPAYAGQSNTQLYQSPFDPTVFFLGDGSHVYEFADSGALDWSFDAGLGYVTDVLPLSNGDVYVSVGYGSTSNVGNLFEIDPSGNLMTSYSTRVFQTTDGSSGIGSEPVVKGEDSSYVLYDGWFYSESGPFTSLVSDAYPLAGTNGTSFYFYKITPTPYTDGTCQDPASEFLLRSYSIGPAFAGGVRQNWQSYDYFDTCNRFPQQLIGSSVNAGLVVTLFSSPPYAATSGETYPAENPYLYAISQDGVTLYGGQTPEAGYTSVATNGTSIYLALPATQQVQVYSLTKHSYATFNVGMPASELLFEHGTLLAIAPTGVEVFGPGMNLEKTIDFAPFSLASFSDSFLEEPALQSPSLCLVNATTYAALLVNSTGSPHLVMGTYV